ncbi:hypothetical protein BDV93DRAFT_310114 [Ceratobasidium sp. AG-I]|nr:hypothetical protein BDV93DRAFT_310114 [Ceratobasidium sp. AG-I]
MFARLKVDYGWTRQSLNEVENLYFHLSRARPVTQPHNPRTNAVTVDEGADDESSTSPTEHGTPTKTSDELPDINPSADSTQTESALPSTSQSQSQPGPSTSKSPDSSSSHPHAQQSTSQQSSTSKRSPFVERTRTGGIVRAAQPVERLRTGGKVKAAPTALSPKKRGRPRIPDGADAPSNAPLAPNIGVGVIGADGGLTYDSFWNSLGTKSDGS